MRFRVAKRFCRVPGQHGDGYNPMYYPLPVNPGIWGSPWAKVKDCKFQCFLTGGIIFPAAVYYYERHFHAYKLRLGNLGKRAWLTQEWLRFNDMDDPDYYIKKQELRGEYERGETVCTYGGTNMIASWLWEPGDPEPDKRRRAPPEGAH